MLLPKYVSPLRLRLLELAAIDISLFFLLPFYNFVVSGLDSAVEFVVVGNFYINFIPIIFLLQTYVGAFGIKNGALRVSLGLCFISFNPSIG